MARTTDPATLAECVALLDEEDRRAVRRYWDRVVREEWVEPSRWMARPAPVERTGRQRREARRAIARIAAAGRVAAVVSLPTSTPVAAGSGVAA